LSGSDVFLHDPSRPGVHLCVFRENIGHIHEHYNTTRGTRANPGKDLGKKTLLDTPPISAYHGLHLL